MGKSNGNLEIISLAMERNDINFRYIYLRSKIISESFRNPRKIFITGYKSSSSLLQTRHTDFNFIYSASLPISEKEQVSTAREPILPHSILVGQIFSNEEIQGVSSPSLHHSSEARKTSLESRVAVAHQTGFQALPLI